MDDRFLKFVKCIKCINALREKNHKFENWSAVKCRLQFDRRNVNEVLMPISTLKSSKTLTNLALDMAMYNFLLRDPGILSSDIGFWVSGLKEPQLHLARTQGKMGLCLCFGHNCFWLYCWRL